MYGTSVLLFNHTLSVIMSKRSTVRIATTKDLDELAAMNQRAFLGSIPQNFFAGRDAVRCFWRMYMTAYRFSL